MQRAVMLPAVVFLAATPLGAATQTSLNPLSKVVDLLGSLAAKIAKEGEAEMAAYKQYVEWCDDVSTQKQFEIKTATSEKEQLEAAIGKASGDAMASVAKIDELVASIATDDGDLKSATTVRNKEAEDFASNDAELVDVIETLGRAITILEREMAKNPAAFAQVDASNLDGLLKTLGTVVDAAAFPTADRQKLLALVQSRQTADADDDELGAPAASVYKTHSTSILDVLEDLKEKAEEQLSGLRKAEKNQRHNFEMLQQSLRDSMKADTKDLDDEKAAKASSEEAKATAQGDLAVTTKALADAKRTLESANGNCMQVAADHDATVKARDVELSAIAEAKKVLEESTAGAVSQAYSLLQVRKAGALLHSRADLAGAEVVTLVKRLAKEHHSAALSQLASRISAVMRLGGAAGEDPFAKVRGLISELISKLEAEAGAETTEKAFCDDQTAKTEEKKGELEGDISKLTAKVDKATAKSAGLKDDVKELQAELAALAKQQAEMDRMRRDAHAAFVQAKADLEAGLEGVRKALGVLRDYYGAGAALLQGGAGLGAAMQQPTAPELHAKAAGAGGSIIGLLEVVESDFAKALAAEETEEDDAASEYEKTTQENKVTRTLKSQDVAYKTRESKGLDKSVADLTADRETADAELGAVLEYYAKIKARCIARPETYEARKQRRLAEIQGLKEALSILEDETAFVQKSRKGGRGTFLGVREA